MTFEIIPHIGVGTLRFGMTQARVRHAIQSSSEPSNKARSQTPSDYFSALGLFIYYDDGGICHAAEFFGPASPSYQDRPLLGEAYREVESWIRSIDPGFILNDAGFDTYRFGFGVYAPSFQEDPALPIESVIVFDEHY